MPRFSEKIRYKASPILLQCLDGLEQFATHINHVYEERQVQVNIHELVQAPSNDYVGQTLWLIYGIYTAKYRELLDSVIRATNDEDFLIFALSGRATIETTATLRYYNNKLLAIIKSAKDLDAFSKEEIADIVRLLDKHSRGGRFDWTQFWSSPRQDMAMTLVAARRAKKGVGDPNPLPNPSQVNIQTAIDAWAADQPEIILFYDFFCELVHPNLGSNFMIMGSKDGYLQLCGNTVKGVGRSLAVEGIKFLAPTVHEAALCMVNLISWAATTKRPPD